MIKPWRKRFLNFFRRQRASGTIIVYSKTRWKFSYPLPIATDWVTCGEKYPKIRLSHQEPPQSNFVYRIITTRASATLFDINMILWNESHSQNFTASSIKSNPLIKMFYCPSEFSKNMTESCISGNYHEMPTESFDIFFYMDKFLAKEYLKPDSRPYFIFSVKFREKSFFIIQVVDFFLGYFEA